MTEATRLEAGKPHPVQPYAWLLKAALDVSAMTTPRIYITSHTQPVQWGNKTWEPFPFGVQPWSIDGKGRRDTIEIVLDNRSLEASRLVAHGRGFRDMPFELYAIQVAFATLGNSDSVISFTGYIDEPVVTSEAVQLTVRQSKASSRRWPWMRYVPACHATYKDPETCGYVGNLTSCAKTLTDCIAHGADERANRNPVIHPQRARLFPGIPRASR